VGILADLLASLAVGILKALWARHDLKESVRKDIAIATLALNQQALAWLVATDPTIAAALRVHDGAESITIACPLARPECPASALPVPPGEPNR